MASGDAALGFVAQNPAVLCAAAREGRSEVVGRLLAAGAEVDAADSDGTCWPLHLHLAAAPQHMATIR